MVIDTAIGHRGDDGIRKRPTRIIVGEDKNTLIEGDAFHVMGDPDAIVRLRRALHGS
jgi:hypothetical protein